MIEINLVPDVKQEFIRAQRARNTVITVAIFAAVGFGAAVVIVAAYVFGAQTIRGNLSDSSIDSETKKLQQVQDLGKALTLQNQVAKVSDVHAAANVNSRVFDVLATVVPRGDNAVAVSNFSVDTEDKTITIEGQAGGGYKSLDALKKTILATKFEYQTEGQNESQSVPLSTQVSDGDRSYSQDADGNKILRFSISFTYPDELFSRESLNGRVVAPEASNATDSALEIPSSIFTQKQENN